MADRIDTGSTSFRFVLIAALTLAALIPLGLVSCVASDRSENYNKAVLSVGTSWGLEQRFSGPVILIPIAGKKGNGEDFVAVMPERLEVEMAMAHEFRRRGIFEVPVLEVEATANGNFPEIDLQDLQERFGPLRSDQAVLSVGIKGHAWNTQRRFDHAWPGNGSGHRAEWAIRQRNCLRTQGLDRQRPPLRWT